jgi:hypothetical protein
MSDVKVPETAEVRSRREALKKIARYGAVSAPAITLLLAASSKPAKAAPIY